MGSSSCGSPSPDFKPRRRVFYFGDTMATNTNELTDKASSDRMLKWFEFAHLPEHLQLISQPFAQLAIMVCVHTEPGPERTVALRKLLEAKDAAVRARLHPGG